MYRGKTTFICDDCHNVFLAPDIEWHCTSFSVPMPCPKCGSRHTYTGLFTRGAYKMIWKAEDKAAKAENSENK